MSGTDALAALPTIVLAVGAAVVATLGAVLRAEDRAVTWLGIAVATAASVSAAVAGTGDDGFGGAIRRDGASMLAAGLIAATTAATLVLALAEAPGGSARRHQTTALLLLSAAGAVLLAAAAHLLVAFIALQLMALPLYALHGMSGDTRAPDRGLAHFLLGASATAAFAYGTALVYVATGSLTIGALATVGSVIGFVGVALLVAGLAASAALVPFHLWVPRAIVPADPSTGAFIAVVTRVGAVVVLARFAGAITASGPLALDLRATMAVLAAATLVVANLVALRQATLKRLFAYSCIAQGGVFAVGVAAGAAASPAIAFALVVYAVSVIGAFAFVALVDLPDADPSITALRGLARSQPLLVAALAAILVALSGLPPTAGFLAKVYVLESAISAQLAWLVALAALATVVSAAAHLRVLLACLENGPGDAVRGSRVARGAVMVTALAVVVLGIVPGPLLDAVQAVRF